MIYCVDSGFKCGYKRMDQGYWVCNCAFLCDFQRPRITEIITPPEPVKTELLKRKLILTDGEGK